MATDFTSLTETKALALARAPFADGDEVEALLDASKGEDSDETVYFRPYVVLAALFETQWERYVTLRGATGASLEYADPGDAVAGYLAQQARLDDTYELTVPDAWPAARGYVVQAGF